MATIYRLRSLALPQILIRRDFRDGVSATFKIAKNYYDGIRQAVVRKFEYFLLKTRAKSSRKISKDLSRSTQVFEFMARPERFELPTPWFIGIPWVRK